MSYQIFLSVLIVASVVMDSYTIKFTQPISKITVKGKKLKFCEYKLKKMMPKSKIIDPEACLSCSCKKSLKCKTYDKIPGCKLMPGGLSTQNPFDIKWRVMVDKLINSEYVDKYRILQVKTQVVSGIYTYLKLLVTDRLCNLKIYTSLKGLSEISDDPCSIGKNRSISPKCRQEFKSPPSKSKLRKQNFD